MYLEELVTFKQKLLQKVCTSPGIVKYFNADPESGEALGPKDLTYKKIFPYGFIPDTQTDQDVFVCFETSVPNVMPNGVFKRVAVKVFVLCHADWMRLPTGTRADLMSNEIDKQLDKSNFGFGMELMSVKRFMAAKDWYGTELDFEATDFNSLYGMIEQDRNQ